jgi:hypothetical protein
MSGYVESKSGIGLGTVDTEVDAIRKLKEVSVFVWTSLPKNSERDQQRLSRNCWNSGEMEYLISPDIMNY